MKKKNITIIILISALIIFDQASKFLISKYFELGSSFNIIPSFFDITYIKNYGAAFGIMEGKRILFLFMTGVVLSFLIYEMKKYTKDKITCISFILVISGIIGNFIDRLFIGYVRDFMDFKILGHNFAIFNLADSFMVVGAIILCISILMEGKNENKK